MVIFHSFVKVYQRVSISNARTAISPSELKNLTVQGFQGQVFMLSAGVIFSGRTYHITGCDSFTRWYYREIGVEIGENEEVPSSDQSISHDFTIGSMKMELKMELFWRSLQGSS